MNSVCSAVSLPVHACYQYGVVEFKNHAVGVLPIDEGGNKIRYVACRPVPLDEALKMALNGEITDALSLLAILHYARIR
jgi:hypothetical protein